MDGEEEYRIACIEDVMEILETYRAENNREMTLAILSYLSNVGALIF